MIKLRPYQLEALETVMADLRKEPYALLQAATGAGKTIMFSEIIRRWMTDYPSLKIGVLAHRQELISQAGNKLLTVWPEGASKIGLACASVGQVNTQRPVIIGSVQTLYRREPAEALDLLIIDEVHRVPHLEAGGQYHTLIRRFTEINPNLRVLGVTATPFRLGHGYIYGTQCKDGRNNLFPKLNYQISLNDLINGGFLVPITAKEGASIGSELADIKLKHGEYDAGQLNSLLLKNAHIESAVDAYTKYGEGRNKVVIFAASIEHAEKLTKAFSQAGHEADCIHSKLPKESRHKTLSHFDSGSLKILVNVDILTEGWDSPRVNLVMLCRPTKSPALFVQMVGRGTRLHPGKGDLLVLDLAENFKTHGDPSKPNVVVPGAGGAGEAPYKTCPECETLLPASTLSCYTCGHKWQVMLIDEVFAPDMRTVKLPPPNKSRLTGWRSYGHTSFTGNYMFVLEMECSPGGTIRHWLDVEGAGSDYGRRQARVFWLKFSGISSPPETVREAVARAKELKMPDFVTIIKNKGYKAVKEFG